jgi:hypothetical protein
LAAGTNNNVIANAKARAVNFFMINSSGETDYRFRAKNETFIDGV